MVCSPVVRVASMFKSDWTRICIEAILKAINTRLKIVQVDYDLGRLLADGNWTGMMGKIQKGEADVAENLVSITEERSTAVDFSPTYGSDGITFAIEKPVPVPTSLAFFLPFDSSIWIATSTILFLIPLVFQLLLRKKRAYIRILLILLGTLLRQPIPYSSNSWSFKILVPVWSIYTFILSASYSAILLAILTFPSETPAVRNFKELSEAVMKDGYKCFVPKGSAIVHIMVNNEKEYLRTLGKAVLQNGWHQSDFPLMETPDISKRSALVLPRTNLEPVAGPEEWKKHFLSEDMLLSFAFAFPMKKDFCHKKKFNTLVSRMNNAGLFYKHLYDEQFKQWLAHPESRRVVIKEAKSLGFGDLMVAFISLSAGIIISLLVFIGEIMCASREKTIP